MTYDDATVQAGLTAVALNSGNTRKAAKALEDSDTATIPHQTLYRWITEQHQAQYREIQKRVRDEISEDFAEQAERISRSMLDLQEKLVTKVNDDLENMDGKDAAVASHKLSVAFGITNQHKRLERQEPTTISGTLDPHEALRQLATKYREVVKAALDGEAVDITDVVEIPESTPDSTDDSPSGRTETDKAREAPKP